METFSSAHCGISIHRKPLARRLTLRLTYGFGLDDPPLFHQAQAEYVARALKKARPAA
jgi:hypothetical protein